VRAVTAKNGVLCLLSRDESALYGRAEMEGKLLCDKLSERENYIADELYKKNIFFKTHKGKGIGYKIYPNKQKL
jgi:hypothetical protein